jgi:hypothetical protein
LTDARSTAAAPILPGSIEDAKIGGLGIMLVRKASAIHYQRLDGRNRLRVTIPAFDCSGGPPARVFNASGCPQSKPGRSGSLCAALIIVYTVYMVYRLRYWSKYGHEESPLQSRCPATAPKSGLNRSGSRTSQDHQGQSRQRPLQRSPQRRCR